MNTILAVLDAVVNSLWQALAVTALVCLALKFLPRGRVSNNAATRHAIWWATLAVVLVLPASPRLIQMMRPHPQPVAGKVVTTPRVAAAPAVAEPVIVTVAPARTAIWPAAVFAIWAAILLWRVYQIVRSYFYLRGVKRRAAVSPGPLPEIARPVSLLISRDIASPMAVGFLRPAIVLPESLLAELSEPERDHVLLHESAHLAKYDDWSNLAMRIMGGILALHPVAIWILRQIEREREMACDDWVVARTGSARPYAASLARLVELRQGRRGEMLASGLFGSSSRIGDRIEMLLRRGRTFSTRASATGVAASMSALGGLVLCGSLTPRWIAFAQEPARSSFEVASIKPNISGADGAYIQALPGRLVMTNFTLRQLILSAYGVRSDQISGFPSWISSDHYDIQAKSEGNASVQRMEGPMLQALIEDRFKVMLHRETRQLPVFELTVAKGGLKLRPSKEGSCTPYSMDSPPPAAPAPGSVPPTFCGFPRSGFDGLHRTLEGTGVSIATLATNLSRLELHRTIIDRTGLPGTFDVHLKWSSDAPAGPGGPGTAPAPNLTEAPSIFTAVQQQLGLKLESTKGPVEVLIIDHVEKPGAN